MCQSPSFNREFSSCQDGNDNNNDVVTKNRMVPTEVDEEASRHLVSMVEFEPPTLEVLSITPSEETWQLDF